MFGSLLGRLGGGGGGGGAGGIGSMLGGSPSATSSTGPLTINNGVPKETVWIALAGVALVLVVWLMLKWRKG